MYRQPRSSDVLQSSATKHRALRTAITFFLTLLLAGGLCLLFRRAEPAPSRYQPLAQPVSSCIAENSALPTCITTALPKGTASAVVSFSSQRMASGRLLLIDREHPLPEECGTPNTFNILATTHGSLTCRDTQAVLGADAMAALDDLFLAARQAHINQLTILRATLSPQQQKSLQIERFCELAETLPLENALTQTLHEIAAPGCSEHQTAWAVDIRICDGWDKLPRSEPLSRSKEGRWLLENCWRYGLIYRYPNNATSAEPGCAAYHFRYVGRAHAAMMHALSLSLEDYLQLLHEQGVLTLWNAAGQPQCTVLCALANPDLSVYAPVQAQLEDVSLDNLGWGIAAYLWPGA